MLDYEEELKKFKPCLAVDEIEDTIYNKDITDVVDLLKDMRLTKTRDGGERKQ